MATIRCAQIAGVLETILKDRLNAELEAEGLPTVPDDNYYIGSTFVDMPIAAGVLPAICIAWNEPHGSIRRDPMGLGRAFQARVAMRLWYGLEFRRANAKTQLDAAEHGAQVVGDILDEYAMDYGVGGMVWWKAGFWTVLSAGHFRSATPRTDTQFTAGTLLWQARTFSVVGV